MSNSNNTETHNSLHPVDDEIRSYVYEEPADIADRLTIAQYNGIEIQMPEIPVCTDEEVDMQCREKQKENAEVTDGILKATDCLVTYDKVYSSTEYDPVEIPQPFVKDITDGIAESGKQQFAEMDNWAVGQPAGYVFSYVEGIPEDFSVKEVAGHTLNCTATLKVVKAIPELTDEFVHEKLDPECSTVDEYKAKLKAATQENYNYQDYCDSGQTGFNNVVDNSENTFTDEDKDYMMKSYLKEVALQDSIAQGFEYFDDMLTAMEITFDKYKEDCAERTIRREVVKLDRNYIYTTEAIVPGEEEEKYAKYTNWLSDEEWEKLTDEKKAELLKAAGVNIFIVDNGNVVRPVYDEESENKETESK